LLWLLLKLGLLGALGVGVGRFALQATVELLKVLVGGTELKNHYFAPFISVNMKFIFLFIYSSYYTFTLLFTGL